jgi:hypothetical protein
MDNIGNIDNIDNMIYTMFPQHNIISSSQTLPSRTKCFGTCVPSSGPVFIDNYSVMKLA